MVLLLPLVCCFILPASAQYYMYGSRYNQPARRSRYQNYFQDNSFFRIPSFNSVYNDLTTPLHTTSTTTTTTTTTTERPSALEKWSKRCGKRYSSYKPNQKARRGRIIWTDESSAGAAAAPAGSFPWLASLFLRRASGEAFFMCAATVVSPRVLVSAAHCFNEKYKDSDWFVRVGDNYIAEDDPSEQTFQVDRIIRHENFVPLSAPGGDGRHDIALLVIRPRKVASRIAFDKYVTPACLPDLGAELQRWRSSDCEISGWGMQQYNNSDSYPDSVRAAKIIVSNVDEGECDYLYNRVVSRTGKFCAGGDVDACQEDSGGPLMCEYKGRYQLVGIVSSGKGCGSYPGLYTEVSRYSSWISSWVDTIETEEPAE